MKGEYFMEIIDIETLRFANRNDAYILVECISLYGGISVYDYWLLIGCIGERLERNYTTEMTTAYLESQIDCVVKYKDGYGITLIQEKA
jgi:hypothetical protein